MNEFVCFGAFLLSSQLALLEFLIDNEKSMLKSKCRNLDPF